MTSICIVTDSSAQFTQLTGAYRAYLHTCQLKIQYAGASIPNGEDLKAAALPSSVIIDQAPLLVPPGIDEFRDLFSRLSLNYNHILGIFLSSHMSSCYNNAVEAANSLRGGVNIQIIDSQSMAVGLGILVETALEAVNRGDAPAVVEHLVRSMVPHIYAVLCTPGLSYLYRNSFIDRGQGLIGEMLNLYPIFALEEGKLAPLDKVKSLRHTETYFQEFLDEFDSLRHIAVMQSAPPGMTEIHAIKEHAHEMFPKTPFTAHTINLYTAALIGPRSLGLFVVEPLNNKSR
jgi:DegV family protein with EDD domain